MEPITVRAASEADLSDLLTLYAEAAEGNPVKAPADAQTARPQFRAILADPAVRVPATRRGLPPLPGRNLLNEQ